MKACGDNVQREQSVCCTACSKDRRRRYARMMGDSETMRPKNQIVYELRSSWDGVMSGGIQSPSIVDVRRGVIRINIGTRLKHFVESREIIKYLRCT